MKVSEVAPQAMDVVGGKVDWRPGGDPTPEHIPLQGEEGVGVLVDGSTRRLHYRQEGHGGLGFEDGCDDGTKVVPDGLEKTEAIPV